MAKHYYMVSLREINEDDYNTHEFAGEAIDDPTGELPVRFPHSAEFAWESDNALFLPNNYNYTSHGDPVSEYRIDAANNEVGAVIFVVSGSKASQARIQPNVHVEERQTIRDTANW
jgi:hypothetical protein